MSAAEVLVIEQEYNLVRSDKEGVEAKDVRQKKAQQSRQEKNRKVDPTQ